MKKNYKIVAALFVITSAMYNVNAQTHYGVGSGTQGQFYSYFGVNAGKVSTGANNTFIGVEAGKANEGAGDGTFLGQNAGQQNTNGTGNTFLGKSAGEANTNGYANTFVGKHSGANVIAGTLNTYIGASAGNYSSGNHNIAVGVDAGSGHSGDSNILLGYFAGFKMSGNENIMIGTHSGRDTKTSYNTFIGAKSGFSNVAGAANALYGTEAGYSNTTGSNNAFFGYGSGYTNTKGEKNTYLGYAAGGNPEITNATAIGALSKVTASNSLVLGNNANVGIGLSAPAYQLHLSTDAAAKLGTPTWSVASDRRLKKDISDYTDGLEMLRKIHPVWFRYNGEAGAKTDKKFVGIIAQEMQEIAPYTIGNFTYQDSLGNKTEYLDYDAGAVTYILVNAVKEQQEIIDQKETKIQDLAKRLEQLERIVASNTMKPLTGNSAARQEPNANGVMLEQNAPNGFSQSTAIRFFIPQDVKEAVINVYSVDGIKVGSYPVQDRGESTLRLAADQFTNGVFVYDLITDGKSNGAKKMMVNK